VPPEIPSEHVHPGLHLEFEEGVAGLSAAIAEVLPGARRVGVDELTGPMLGGLVGRPGVELVDGGGAIGAARLSKTADEVACLRRAQRINELAMYDVEAALRPGVRENELSAIFYRRIFELGATTNIIDPIWSITPPSIAAGTLTTNGDVGFPLASNDRFLREGDVVLPDTGLTWNGYHSDFGKTWITSLDPRPSAGLRECYDRWQEVIHAIYAAIKPGATCGDLVRAAQSVEPKPALAQFYIGHGNGCDSAEPPIIGSDLGLAFDDTVVLVPGMTFVLEPVVWRDGVGGYRSEEIVAVTESGFDLLTQYPHTPFE
jgi:Xaa-Pro aminopeptidase